jgi:hypothetical protein
MRLLGAPFAVLAFALLAGSLASPARAEEPVRRGSVRPFHLNLGGGVFQPWDGDTGHTVSGMLHRGFGSDRFWVGGEVEYRRYEPDLKRGYQPDMDTWAVRFQFQYHPFPKAIVSPYVGVAVGFLVSRVEQNRASDGDRVRDDVSGGTTLLALAGFEIPLPFVDPLQLFAEGRLGNASDAWKRKGGNYQMDQVGGVTGLCGLRVRF